MQSFGVQGPHRLLQQTAEALGTQSVGLEALSGPGEKEGDVPLFCMSSVMSDSWRPHGRQPTRLLCPWDSPGKITGVGSHFLLQGIFLTQGIDPTSLASSALAGRFFRKL